MVIGEPQILGQMKDAVRIAEEFDQPGSGAFVNGVLHRVLVEDGGAGPADSNTE